MRGKEPLNLAPTGRATQPFRLSRERAEISQHAKYLVQMIDKLAVWAELPSRVAVTGQQRPEVSAEWDRGRSPQRPGIEPGVLQEPMSVSTA
jgi:hypothetical protein